MEVPAKVQAELAELDDQADTASRNAEMARIRAEDLTEQIRELKAQLHETLDEETECSRLAWQLQRQAAQLAAEWGLPQHSAHAPLGSAAREATASPWIGKHRITERNH